MTNHIPKEFDQIFGTLKKADQCTSAKIEKNPSPCEFTELGNLTYCKVHKGLLLRKE